MMGMLRFVVLGGSRAERCLTVNGIFMASTESERQRRESKGKLVSVCIQETDEKNGI